VRTVHDHTSAAAFCTSHGAVVPPRAAAHLAERAGLAAWAPAPPPTSTPSTDPPTDSPETKRLLHLLLTIYTADTTTTTYDAIVLAFRYSTHPKSLTSFLPY